MYKLLLVLFSLSLFACNNSGNEKSNTTTATTTTATTPGLPADSNARAATFSFVDGCMDNFRIALGEPKAYAFCKCIYNQIKTENPGADSVAIEELARDTARVSRMAAKCR